MEASFCWRQRPSADGDGSPAIPGGIALQRLGREPSTDAGDEARLPRLAPNSQRNLQPSSICPAVHVVADFCSDVAAKDAILDTHGLYRFHRDAF